MAIKKRAGSSQSRAIFREKGYGNNLMIFNFNNEDKVLAASGSQRDAAAAAGQFETMMRAIKIAQKLMS